MSNSGNTESLAINAVSDSIDMTDHLKSSFAKGDKEPSWDGYVIIYKNKKSDRKDNIIGRVSVQIKGTVKKDFSKSEVSFSMPITDLKNYLHDGGTVLFVVYIDCSDNKSSTPDRKIYYSALTPVELYRLIKDAKGKNSKTVKLKEFPLDNTRKEEIILNCYNDCIKQVSFNGTTISLDELEKSGQFEGLSISVSTFGENNLSNARRALFNNDVYVYANLKNSPIPHPLGKLKHIQEIEEREDPILIDGKEYYSSYKIITEKDGRSYKIGNSLTIQEMGENRGLKINYRNSTWLRILVKDLEFMISYMRAGSLCIKNKMKVPFKRENADLSNFTIKKQEEFLCYLKKIVQVLDLLGYDRDIDLKKLTSKEESYLSMLVTAFIDQKPVKILQNEHDKQNKIDPISKMSIGEATFALIFKPCAGKIGMYEIYDFFAEELRTTYRGSIVSQYIVLQAEDLCCLNNLKVEVLLPSFQCLERKEETYVLANLFLLELLKAYDISDQKRKDLLDTALLFAEWIQSSEDNHLDKCVCRLNYLQTIRRKRDFNSEEIDELYLLGEDNETGEDVKTAAYLLLGIKPLAQRHFNKLSLCDQNIFKNTPIYYFWDEQS